MTINHSHSCCNTKNGPMRPRPWVVHWRKGSSKPNRQAHTGLKRMRRSNLETISPVALSLPTPPAATWCNISRISESCASQEQGPHLLREPQEVQPVGQWPPEPHAQEVSKWINKWVLEEKAFPPSPLPISQFSDSLTVYSPIAGRVKGWDIQVNGRQ